MPSPRINIGGKIFFIFDQYKTKSEATKKANLARRTGLFEHVRVVLMPVQHPAYKAKYAIACRGSKRDPNSVSAKQLAREQGLK
jgi:hypothetical protein